MALYSAFARDAVVDVVSVWEIAQIGARLMTSEAVEPYVEAVLRMDEEFGSKESDHPLDRAPGYRSEAAEMVKNDFQGLHRNALVSIYSALEHYLKCMLVDYWLSGAYHGDRPFSDSKFADLTDRSEEARFFGWADRVWKECGRNGDFPSRVQKFLKQHGPTAVDAHIQKQAGERYWTKLNEGYLLRNSIVHAGGRVTSDISLILNLPKGESIRLTKSLTGRCLRIASRLVEEIDNVSPYGHSAILASL